MPKKKTSKTAAKRFKLTGRGKLKHAKAGGSHLLTGKSRKRRRGFGRGVVTDHVESRRIKAMLV